MYQVRLAVIVALIATLSQVAAAEPGTINVSWGVQYGGPQEDWLFGVDTDGLGNVYTVGRTYGSLDGANAGNRDPFLSKFTADGTHLWTRQFGTSSDDRGYSIAADGLGNVFVTGFTRGTLGDNSFGDNDVFVAKYDSAGTQLWGQQFGTAQSDRPWGLAADGHGNVYVTGRTEGSLASSFAGGEKDMFVGKMNSSGDFDWLHQVGTSGDDRLYSAAVDADGRLYVVGYTTGTLGSQNYGGSDAFVSCYNSDGTSVWSKQLGTAMDDFCHAIVIDGQAAYLAGSTMGSLEGINAGDLDLFVTKLAFDGTEEWTRQIGTTYLDESWGLGLDGEGHVILGGYVNKYSEQDLIFAGFTADGDLIALSELDGEGTQQMWAMTNGDGVAYAVGFSDDSYFGPHLGGADAIIMAVEVPEPATLSLLALGSLTLIRRRKA